MYWFLVVRVIFQSREYLRKRTNKVNQVKGVFREEAFCQLSMVITVDEELNVLG
jgi:hypothetical protein